MQRPMRATVDEAGILTFDGNRHEATDLALLLLRFVNGKEGPLPPRMEKDAPNRG